MAESVPDVLAEGEVEVRGRMPWSSNGTFLVELTLGDEAMLAIYKPLRGERPLWDFPHGLYRREAAAWVLSEQAGLGVVPTTIVRDGPLGLGSFQRFVAHDPDEHHFTLVEDAANHPALMAICVLDLLANNTDRKSGHCLHGEDGGIWAIDNGLCFHPEPKLRTVIWEFAGQDVPEPLLRGVEALLPRLPGALADLLEADELDALGLRAERLLARSRFPHPDPNGRCWPWPLV
jgi:uncharacterized repeat protein (TIGR03843 family)